VPALARNGLPAGGTDCGLWRNGHDGGQAIALEVLRALGADCIRGPKLARRPNATGSGAEIARGGRAVILSGGLFVWICVELVSGVVMEVAAL
jgi:hypothetical protein